MIDVFNQISLGPQHRLDPAADFARACDHLRHHGRHQPRARRVRDARRLRRLVPESQFGLGLYPCLVLSFFIVGALGWLVERLLIRRLYGRVLDTILATWGLGVILQQAVRLGAGAELRYVKMPDVLSRRRARVRRRRVHLPHLHSRPHDPAARGSPTS